MRKLLSSLRARAVSAGSRRGTDKFKGGSSLVADASPFLFHQQLKCDPAFVRAQVRGGSGRDPEALPSRRRALARAGGGRVGGWGRVLLEEPPRAHAGRCGCPAQGIMSRGNQREIDRKRAQARKDKANAGKKVCGP